MALVEDLDDAALMLRVQGDDSQAFGVLFDRLKLRAYRLAYATVRDGARAEDVVQEAFLSIWRSRGTYAAGQGSVGTWVLSVVKNRAIDSLRHNDRHDRRRAQAADEFADWLPGAEDLEAATIERDDAAHLRRALGRLPDSQRDVITLAYFGELSAPEIATRLTLPLGTVKGRIRLGLRKLREPESGRT